MEPLLPHAAACRHTGSCLPACAQREHAMYVGWCCYHCQGVKECNTEQAEPQGTFIQLGSSRSPA